MHELRLFRLPTSWRSGVGRAASTWHKLSPAPSLKGKEINPPHSYYLPTTCVTNPDASNFPRPSSARRHLLPATMSTTTTQTRTRRDVLVDYELHHSPATTAPPASRSDGQAGDSAGSQAAAARSPPPPPVPWDTTHRRVPPYRPLNRDPEHLREVRTYNNRAEQVFVATMFTGLCINSVS